MTPSGGSAGDAPNEASTTPSPPATLLSQQAARERARALRFEHAKASAKELSRFVEENLAADPDASILVGIKELLGFYEPPDEFPEKLERFLSELTNKDNNPALGVNFSEMHKIHAETILAKLPEVDLSKIDRLHLSFALTASTKTGIEAEVESVARALSAIGEKNP
ncbi:MAG: hypothetical protein ACREX0_00735, partial [Noviherbaspirillum sp.]